MWITWGCFMWLFILPPDWAMLKKALMEYERKHIQPLIKAQHKRFQENITSQERKKLANLVLENKALKKALAVWQNQPTNLADRDAILKKIANIRTELLPLQQKYAKLLDTFSAERAKLKPLWKMDMDAIIAKYNAEIDENLAPLFAKHNFANYDDDDEFLLWQKEEEAAAGANED